MAVGSYDANGIWQYGESDNISPFSTLLNKLAASTSSSVTGIKSRVATLEANNLPGTIPVVPTSVTKSGGTSTVTALGQVSVDGVTSVILNGVFTSNYKNYKLVMNWGKTASNGYLFGAFTTAGVQMGANCRNQIAISSGSGTIVTSASYAQTYFPIQETPAGLSTVRHGHTELDLYSPQNADWGGFTGMSVSASSTAWTTWAIGGSIDDSNQYDGLKIYTSGGYAFSAVISIYGYND